MPDALSLVRWLRDCLGLYVPSALGPLALACPCWPPSLNRTNLASSSAILVRVRLGGIGGVVGNGSMVVWGFRVLAVWGAGFCKLRR